MAGGGLQASTCLQTALLLAVHWSVTWLAPLCPLFLYPRFLSKGSRLSIEWLGVGRLSTGPCKPARQTQSSLTSYLVGSISHSDGSQLCHQNLDWLRSAFFGAITENTQNRPPCDLEVVVLCCLDRTDLGLSALLFWSLCCSGQPPYCSTLFRLTHGHAEPPESRSESFHCRASVACPSSGI